MSKVRKKAKAAEATKASKLVPPSPLTDQFEKAYRFAHGIPKEAKSEGDCGQEQQPVRRTPWMLFLAVLIGIGARARQGAYSEIYHSPVTVAGLYWHFVDLVWIFLFALIYLPGRSG